MGKNIAVRVHETSEAYALGALYRELVRQFSEDNIQINNVSKRLHVREHLERLDAKINNSLLGFKPDLVIQAYSDVLEDLARYENGPYRTLAIDAAILKACKQVPTPRKKQSYKKECGLENTDKPLVVIGQYTYNQNPEGERLIRSLLPYATVVIVPLKDTSAKDYFSDTLTPNEKAQVIEFCGMGKLAKLYSIADIAIAGMNLKPHHGRLNNFYEQTQNSPVFLVPPKNISQYGYSELIEQGNIIECSDIDDLVQQSIDFLKSFADNSELQQKREEFTEQARAQFFPEIVNSINYILSSGNTPIFFEYTHPESNWAPHYKPEKAIQLFGSEVV